MLAQQAFSTDFLSMWKWGESKGFDVATDSTQIMPSPHALKLAWGEHCHPLVKIPLQVCVCMDANCTTIYSFIDLFNLLKVHTRTKKKDEGLMVCHS